MAEGLWRNKVTNTEATKRVPPFSWILVPKLFLPSRGNLNYIFGYRDQQSLTVNIKAVNTAIAPGTVPVNSSIPFDENDDHHPRASSAECVFPKVAEKLVEIGMTKEVSKATRWCRSPTEMRLQHFWMMPLRER